jgi:NAD(P)-dependent dehydrogenase (short-subunit alcohol dehydrogenase family)/acyl dehydratase/putative sterol carrier protein
MALNLDAVGQKLGPLTKTYTWKDVVLYALGVGAGESDLNYCYEKDLKVIPSFSIASIFDILAEIGIKSEVNLAGVLHGEQELIFHNPIPIEGTMTTEGRISHIYDKGEGRGALIVGESDTLDADGNKLFTSICTVFGRLDGGFGGDNAPANDLSFPDHQPDVVVAARPAPHQPLLYRLSGDTFSLHVDPEFARMSGFEKPIMHGLCTHGYACRALCDALIPGEPQKARRMACRFSKPLYPGVPIEIHIWKAGQGSALWRVINAETGDVVIDKGVFEYGEAVKPRIGFDDRVAIVTGAGAGLGRAYALELARRGAKVVVNDLGGARDGSGAGSSAAADQVVEEIRALGGRAVANYDSVATPEGGAAIVQSALDAFGTVDILINNAGILRDKSLVKMEPQNWQAVLDVHLNGAYNVSRPAFAVMRDKGYGRILMTTSAAGLYGNFGQANYAAAKMGLVGLMNTLKLEGEKRNIKVNTIAPLAASRLTEDILPPDLFAKMKPEFVVPMALFLCSEACPVSGHIYNAGMGYYNRAAVMTGPGAVPAGAGAIPTVEEIRDGMARIDTLNGAKVYNQLNEQVMDALDALTAKPAPAPAQTAAAAAATGFAATADVFAAMPGAFKAEAATGVNAVFQYRISGEGGGDWFCQVENAACSVTAGTHPQATCCMLMNSGDFLDMMNGRLPAMQAYTSGKLKIEGDVMKSQLIQKLFKL